MDGELDRIVREASERHNLDPALVDRALMAEMMIGRHGGRSVIGTMQVLVTRDGLSRGWKVFGVLATSDLDHAFAGA